eukprot:CAMPEP_0171563998 /NCGR_PEP_ID=MMETSP0960-20121227/16031_1 /TAXON_ID=87120 /ORGANISM="Aurantiochytrium limacinum, Strain ATCCMYA-1381" /LENGTH=411 /DNA_ID=CAMNT_0012117307 /DNA_START=345 /DNA_END=1578 /DNA_ORIENTATION=+
MFCGDETAALVGDLGSRTFKFGFAGEDMPRGWIPSATGHVVGQSDMDVDDDKGRPKSIVGESALQHRCEDVDITWAREDGFVKNWDVVEDLWTHAVWARLAEILLEKLETPAVFMPRNAILSAFSVGRATSLVVDVGAAKTCACAVHDGFVLRKSVRTSKIAGDYIDEHLLRLLETQILPSLKASSVDGANSENGDKDTKEASSSSSSANQASANQQKGGSENSKEITSQLSSGSVDPPKILRVPCTFRRKLAHDGSTQKQINLKTTEELARIKPSFIRLQQMPVLTDLEANVCRVWTEVPFVEAQADEYAKEEYELPDGTERFRSPELLMRPETDMAYMKEKIPAAELDKGSVSLPDVLKDSLQSAHVDLRRELVQQIMLVGGGAMIPGTIERLTKELALNLPSALKPRF